MDRNNIFKNIIAVTFIFGILFIVSGIGKLFAFQGFIETIVSITHFSYTIAFLIGLGISGFEIGGGVAFIFRYRVSLFVMLFSILIGIFIIVLTMALIENRNLLCHCFGIFDFGLSNYHELILDVILLDILVLYGMYISLMYSILFQRRLLLALFLILLAYVEYSIIQPLSKRQYIEGKINTTEIVAFAEHEMPNIGYIKNKTRLIFLLIFGDFSCPPCFDSFISLAESLQDRLPPEDRYRAVGIMREDEMMNRATPNRFLHWKEANDLTLPIVIASDTVFVKMHNGKSAVLLLNSESQILFMKSFPLSYEQVKLVLKMME